MSLWDALAVLLIIGLGILLWRQKETNGWVDWLIKFVIITSLIFGPYFFWDEIASYWSSSSSGPVDLQQGWW